MSVTELYDALCSSDIGVVKELLQDRSPDGSSLLNENDLCDNLARAYEEIKLKNIPLAEEIDYLVTSKLVENRFFTDKNNNVAHEVVLILENVLERIQIIEESSLFLIKNYQNKNVDDNFSYRVRIIVQHTSILKKYLKTTYSKLPWEEMEFCLLLLHSLSSKWDASMDVYRLVLDRKRVLNYLSIFCDILTNLQLTKKDVNSKTRLQGRETLVRSVIANTPAFKELYDDYEIVRDVFSLNRINSYIQQSLDSKSLQNRELEKLIIERSLQVIGENLKNSTESPNVSNHVHDVLTNSAPINLKTIITSLRDSMSHAHSLVKRFQIEKNEDKFFGQIVTDLMAIQIEINVVLNERKVHAFEKFSNKIQDCVSLEEAKYLLSELTLKDTNSELLMCNHLALSRVDQVRKIIADISEKIPDKTTYELMLFDKISSLLELQKEKMQYTNKRRNNLFVSFNEMRYCMNNCEDLSFITRIFRNVNRQMRQLGGVTENYFSKIQSHLNEIKESLLSRKVGDDVKSADDLINHALLTIDIEAMSVKKIHEFQDDLEKDDVTESHNKKQTANVLEHIANLPIPADMKSKISDGFAKKMLVPGIKSELIAILNEFKRDPSRELTEDTLKQWEVCVKQLDLKKQTEENLVSHLKNKNLKGCENTINLVEDTYSALEKSFNDSNIFINKKQQDALKSLLNSLKLKKSDVENIMNKFLAELKGRIEIYYTERLDYLENLLRSSNIYENFIKNRQLQVLVEALLLDLLEILEDMSLFTDNRLFTDIHAPILVGKALRNYLAHGNVYLDSLPYDTSLSLLCNALKLISCGKSIFNMKNLLVGKLNVCKNNYLRDRNIECINYLGIQHELFRYIAEDDVENIENCIKKGANIFARTTDGGNALHNAAVKDAINTFKFLVDKRVDVYLKDNSNREPLHVAVINGSKKVVEHYLENNFIINAYSDGTTILHLAARHGHERIVEKLLGTFEVNVTSKHGLTPLHAASQHNRVDVIKLLLSKDADVLRKTGCSYTALHYASRSGNGVIVELLLNNKQSNRDYVNGRTSRGFTPLYLAALSGHTAVVDKLLKSGANPYLGDENDNTVFKVCARYRHIEVIKLLYDNFTAISSQNQEVTDQETRESFENSLLKWACFHGYPAVIEFLLERTGKLDHKIQDGVSALQMAAQEGHEDVAKILLDAGADVNFIGNGQITALHSASQNGFVDTVKLLLAAGAKTDVLDSTGLTPLCMASLFGHAKVVSVLLSRGADVNLTSLKKVTPLHAAVHSTDCELLKVLLQAGATVDAQTEFGVTALHLAAEFGSNEMVSHLLKEGASVNQTMKSDYTPLHLACRRGYKTVATTLVDKGAEVKAKTARQFQGSSDDLRFVHSWSNCSGILNVEGLTPLHLAALNGSYETVVYLLDKNADFDVADGQGCTPLSLASQNGYAKIVSLLLKRGAGVDVILRDNITPLILAVQTDFKKTAAVLLKAKASVNAANINGFTALHFAALYGYSSLISLLLDHDADVNQRTLINTTPLHLAVLSQNEEGVRLLLNRGADVNAMSDNSVTPLDFAVFLKQREIIRVLCESGATLNPTSVSKLQVDSPSKTPQYGTVKLQKLLEIEQEINEEGVWSPLTVAASQGGYDVLCDLLSYGADPNLKIDISPLHVACMKGHNDIVEKLLEVGADIEASSPEMFTPLFAAIQENRTEVVQTLINAGAKVKVYNIERATPLVMAVIRGNPTIIQLLLQHDADIDERFKGQTPLYLACKENSVQKVKTLLDRNADVGVPTEQGWTALHVASSIGNDEIVSPLLEHNADTEFESIERLTPIHLAAQNGHASVVDLLVSRGAKVDVMEMDGATPLFLSSSYGHLEVVECLLKHGANVDIGTGNKVTPLQIAIVHHHHEIVRRLLREGANVNTQSKAGHAPLHLAIMIYDIAIVCDLLVNGAVIDADSEYLMTREQMKRNLI